MILTGLFNNVDSAEIAFNTLSKRGYTKGEIFYARLHDKDSDGRIVIGIRPRNQKDAEFFVNEWDTVYQHPRNAVKAQTERDDTNNPKEADKNVPSRKEYMGDRKPARKTVPGVRQQASLHRKNHTRTVMSDF